MKSKVVLLAGVAVGYVLGTRAGREQYEKIRTQAKAFWGDPRVQEQVHHAQETVQQTVKEQAPVVQQKLTDASKKVAEKTGARRDGELNESGSGI